MFAKRTRTDPVEGAPEKSDRDAAAAGELSDFERAELEREQLAGPRVIALCCGLFLFYSLIALAIAAYRYAVAQ